MSKKNITFLADKTTFHFFFFCTSINCRAIDRASIHVLIYNHNNQSKFDSILQINKKHPSRKKLMKIIKLNKNTNVKWKKILRLINTHAKNCYICIYLNDNIFIQNHLWIYSQIHSWKNKQHKYIYTIRLVRTIYLNKKQQKLEKPKLFF